MSDNAQTKDKDNKDSYRLNVRLDPVTYEHVKYWANRHGVSMVDYIRDSIDLAIRYENKDYDIPTVEVVRLNQLVDGYNHIVKELGDFKDEMVFLLNNIYEITRGTNYLNKDDN